MKDNSEGVKNDQAVQFTMDHTQEQQDMFSSQVVMSDNGAKLYDNSSMIKHDTVSGGKDHSDDYTEGAQTGPKA